MGCYRNNCYCFCFFQEWGTSLAQFKLIETTDNSTEWCLLDELSMSESLKLHPQIGLMPLVSEHVSHGESGNSDTPMQSSDCAIFLTSNHLSPRLRPPCFSTCCKWPSGIQLFATLWTVSPPGSSVHGILQARILEWVAMPFSRR